MNLAEFRALLTAPGQDALEAAVARAPRETDFLADFQVLIREYPPELARAALETAILRREAARKFPMAGRMYFTREALEQASASEVSAYRASRFRPFGRLADLGCSVGGDTFPLAEQAPTLGIDLDPLRLGMAASNARALGLEDRTRFIQADLNAPLPLGSSPDLGLFFDPARRAGGRRIFTVRDYHPPLALAPGWLARFQGLGVKISPGVKLAELRSFDAEVEFISLRGELKEATLWFGSLKSTQRRATVLPGPHTLAADHFFHSDDPKAQPDEPGQKETALPIRPPQAYLYEPDPAVLRAGLVGTLGMQLGAAQLDPDIAYLTAEKQTPTPFSRVWAVEGWLPFGLKRLRAYLRERKVGRVVVKKRGSPLQPEALIRDLKLKGEAGRVIFLTHLEGKAIVIICFEPEDRKDGSSKDWKNRRLED